MQNATFLHGSHDHSFFEELLEGLTPILPGGEKTVEFLGHLFTDLLQIYLLLLLILFVVFWLQSFVDTGRMQHRLAGLKSVWGYLLAFALGLLSPFCSCGIIPVLMGLVAAGVPVAVCLCMYTTASLMNLTALTALYSIAGPAFTGVYLCCSLLIVAASSVIFSRLRFQGAARDFQLAHDHHEHCHDHDHHEHHDGCCGEDCHHDARPANAKKRAARALADSLRVLQKSWAWILLGVALAAALEAYVPLQSLSELIGGHTVLSGLIAALIGFPIHSDIFSIAPVLLLLMDLSDTVAMIFALAAMVISVPGVIMLAQALRPKAVAQYAGVLIVLTLLCGAALVPVLG